MHDLLGAYERLDRMYQLYIRSAFPLRSPELARERDAALEARGVLSQPPLIETVPVYESSRMTLADVAKRLPPEFADVASLGAKLFTAPDGTPFPLYKHQWQSLEQVLIKKRDIVVTTGTGSGKTECFLLPLMAQLARESKAWEDATKPDPKRFWWRKGDGDEKSAGRASQWTHMKRPAALRAIVLYPLNALVEDQLRRLRMAIDNDDIHRWMDDERGRNRITFGRYTGATPVSGGENSNSLGRLRRALREEEGQNDSLKKYLGANPSADRDVLYHFPRMDGGEMWSRWDMQKTPPDVLITNYSMLNIMMMRSIEASIFDETKKWLHEEGHLERQFFLIIDELHAYRGTPGTEVSYILRLLLTRLGLTPDSDKLRILTTTASLEPNDAGRKFLREFFGRDNFEFITAPQIPPKSNARLNLKPFETAFSTFAQTVQPKVEDGPPAIANSATEGAMGQLATALGISPTGGQLGRDALGMALADARVGAADALRDAARATSLDGTVRPVKAPLLDNALFGTDLQMRKPSDAMRGLMLALGMSRTADGRSPQPGRGHLFFHNLQNLWVCANHECDKGTVDRAERDNAEKSHRPTVGAVHTEHRIACDCGSRVLDLIVCEVCGDVFMGGYKSLQKLVGNSVDILTADQPDLEKMPDRVVMSQKYGQYAVFWPAPFTPDQTPFDLQWSYKPDKAMKKGLECEWRPALLGRTTGILTVATSAKETLESFKRKSTFGPDPDFILGWAYVIKSTKDNVAANDHSAMPHKCPRCDADYRKRTLYKSPLRNHRTGFQKACQVLAGTVLREMQDDASAGKSSRKLVIFTDSRQDAAKLAAGMERDHYRDMLRFVLKREFDGYWGDFISYLKTEVSPTTLTSLLALNPKLHAEVTASAAISDDVSGQMRFITSLQETAPLVLTEAERWTNGKIPINAEARDEWIALLSNYPGPVPLFALRGPMFQRLLEKGICPGGSSSHTLNFRDNDKEWKPWHECWNWLSGTPQAIAVPSDGQSKHVTKLQNSLLDEVMYALFPHLARTLEGLGQGYVSYRPKNNPSPELRSITEAVIRQMGTRRLHRFARHFKDGNNDSLRSYSDRYVNYAGELDRLVQAELMDSGAAISSDDGLALNPQNLALMPSYSEDGFRCPSCNAFFLHDVKICPECEILTAIKPSFKHTTFDYYTELTDAAHAELFRMNCEEMTGQTDAHLRPKRQRWFQDIFVADEIGAVRGVDLLSVTTTMEAGVDIGALNAVMMANMPPRRFNYQQRVGRAGRRASGVSLAVTFCRGRSHDDFYYQRPESMTGDAPPPPYVDMTAQPIFERVLVKEALRRAFCELVLLGSEPQPDSVHGEFGASDAWQGYADQVQDWLRTGATRTKLREVITALSVQTPWQGDAAFAARMETFLCDELVPRITAITDDKAYTQKFLSERLANAGLLPMFGFPTRVRFLYCQWPRSGREWPPESGVVDRDLDLAISQFAPRSETVKDKSVYTSVGVVELEPAGSEVKSKDGFYPPLPGPNDRTAIGLCDNCQAVMTVSQPALFLGGEEPEHGDCSVCNSQGTLRLLDAREPKGFFTDQWREEFDGQFEWVPRSTRPTMSVDVAQGASWSDTANARVCSFPKAVPILSFNDDGGKGGFDFHPAKVFDKQRPGAYAVKPPHDDYVKLESQSYRVALLSRRLTDVLLVQMQEWPTGVSADTETVEGRAAWYSLAFWLRIAAGARLDVDPLELDAGLSVAQGGNQTPIGQAFLCDKLENGAGYCRFLAQPGEWTQLLAHADPNQGNGIAAKWLDLAPALPGQKPHAQECDTSCNRCLRDFANLSYHGLLDWRLALDMARLMLDQSAPIDLQTPWSGTPNPWLPLTQDNATPCASALARLRWEPVAPMNGLLTWKHKTEKRLLIQRHPMWNDHHPVWHGAHKAALREFGGYSVKAVNPFRLLRRPADYC